MPDLRLEYKTFARFAINHVFAAKRAFLKLFAKIFGGGGVRREAIPRRATN